MLVDPTPLPRIPPLPFDPPIAPPVDPKPRFDPPLEDSELPPELEAPGPVEAGLPAKLISGVPELPAELGDSTPRDPELLPEL